MLSFFVSQKQTNWDGEMRLSFMHAFVLPQLPVSFFVQIDNHSTSIRAPFIGFLLFLFCILGGLRRGAMGGSGKGRKENFTGGLLKSFDGMGGTKWPFFP